MKKSRNKVSKLEEIRLGNGVSGETRLVGMNTGNQSVSWQTGST